jgi:hypothetical protein
MRILLVVALSLVFQVVHVEDAAASIWGWLEKYSGPGPFTTLTDVGGATGLDPMLTVTFCPFPEQVAAARTRYEPSFFFTSLAFGLGVPPVPKLKADQPQPRTRPSGLWCLFVDHRKFRAPADPARQPPFPETYARVFDVGATYVTPDGVVEVGAGIGEVELTVAGERVSEHFIITPARLVVRPLYIGPLRKFRWAGFVKLWMKVHRVTGELTGADFGIDPDSFRVNGETLYSSGLTFDVVELLCATLINKVCGTPPLPGSNTPQK